MTPPPLHTNHLNRIHLSTLLLPLLNFFLLQPSFAFFCPTPSSLLSPSTTLSMMSTNNNNHHHPNIHLHPPAIIYTIAGSDSGGGAGIQADLHTIHSLSSGTCHGCSAVTCLTAQNSRGVTDVHVPPREFLMRQLFALREDLPPLAVKVGMVPTVELAMELGQWLSEVRMDGAAGGDESVPLVVVDPVMISTSGHKLVDAPAKEAMIRFVFPQADLITPNKFEAEELLGRKLVTTRDVEEGAREILEGMGPKAVLIKGGHLLEEEESGGGSGLTAREYAQDYLLTNLDVSLAGKPVKDQARLCDGSRGVWLRSKRYDTIHTHGTGCTLSSAIATAWAMGQRQRNISLMKRAEEEKSDQTDIGALHSMYLVDACCIAKAYVNAGIAHAVQIGQGPGPVTHTGFPNSSQNFPILALSPDSFSMPSFRPMRPYQTISSSSNNGNDNHPAVTLGRILPIVDTIDLLQKVLATDGIQDIQLRFKDTTDYATILDRIQQAQTLCQSKSVRLWINDHWNAAIQAGGCFGIHLGQEDLASCVAANGLDAIRTAGLALGLSTHSYAELAAALGVRPSYISLGPIFPTSSKDVKFDPQGLETVRQWRRLIPPEIPLVGIGGIGDEVAAKAVRDAGVECVAVIGAVTKADDMGLAVMKLNEAMS
eukprot:CCRYP_000797-RA/>CCRYP_000797-RA protein AED:0.06 eAED:0.06 QI:0/0.5/0.33/1/1/1/3/231/652